MSSIVRRVLQRFMKPTYLVGRDLEGNTYYEHPNANEGRAKRTVQYQRSDDMWTYIASGKRLPVQWNAWLTHTRLDPPSIEELETDMARQRRVQMNAAILEARDREERERMARLAQPSGSHSQISEPRLEKEPQQTRSEPPVGTRSDSVPTPVRDPWAEAKKGSDVPESWSPVVRRK
ncbi:hypothetical protein OG21DRAFT_197254 [Imleria badia]|nr:hypothetical protein OG21DRAFT_197254 [Imleria badia]